MQQLLAVLLLGLLGTATARRFLTRPQSSALNRWQGAPKKWHHSFHASDKASAKVDWAKSLRDGTLETVDDETTEEDRRSAKDIRDEKTLPCGDSTKVPKDWKYLSRLMDGLCSLPTSAPECSSWSTHMECLLKEFYVADCAGVTSAPGDICEKCKDPHFMSGTVTGGTYFPLKIQQFFKKQQSETYSTAGTGEVLGKELLCGASMMVKDGCQGMTTAIPTCYK